MAKQNSERTTTPSRFVRDLATLLVSLVGGASVTKLAPGEEYRGLVWFVIFGVAGSAWLIGVLVSRKWDRTVSMVKHISKSLRIAIGTLIVFVLTLVAYIVMRDAFMESYPAGQEGRKVVTGWTLTEPGQKYFAANPGATREDALMATGGKATAIWTDGSVALCRGLLWLLFSAFMFGGVFIIVFGSDLLALYAKKPTPG